MQQTSIRTKLYKGFGLVLGILTIIFLASVFSMWREATARSETSRSFDISQSAEQVRYQMIHNRLVLSNYLLSGDGREADSVREGTAKLAEMLRDAQAKA